MQIRPVTTPWRHTLAVALAVSWIWGGADSLVYAQYNTIEAPRDYDQDRLNWKYKDGADPGLARQQNWKVLEERARLNRGSDFEPVSVKDPVEQVQTRISLMDQGDFSQWAHQHWKTLAAAAFFLLGCIGFLVRR